MKKLSIAYFGTPSFSAQFLEKLLTDPKLKEKVEVKLVVTQPDKPVGKKQVVTKSPVKIIAEKNHIEILDSKLNSEFLILNSKLKDIDLALVYAYGQIIPKELLALPKYGFFNIHWSLLPKYRGAAPLPYALLLGDKETGVTIFLMDENIDTGPIITQEKIKLNINDIRPAVETKFVNLSYEMLKKVINTLIRNPLMRNELIKQGCSQATYTFQFKKDHGFIPFSTLKKAINNQQLTINDLPPKLQKIITKNHLNIEPYNNLTIYNFFRGMQTWPGLWTFVPVQPGRLYTAQQKRLKIIDMQYLNGKITILRVQLEGKKEVDFNTFNNAYQIF